MKMIVADVYLSELCSMLQHSFNNIVSIWLPFKYKSVISSIYRSVISSDIYIKSKAIAYSVLGNLWQTNKEDTATYITTLTSPSSVTLLGKRKYYQCLVGKMLLIISLSTMLWNFEETLTLVWSQYTKQNQMFTYGQKIQYNHDRMKIKGICRYGMSTLFHFPFQHLFHLSTLKCINVGCWLFNILLAFYTIKCLNDCCIDALNPSTFVSTAISVFVRQARMKVTVVH